MSKELEFISVDDTDEDDYAMNESNGGYTEDGDVYDRAIGNSCLNQSKVSCDVCLSVSVCLLVS